MSRIAYVNGRYVTHGEASVHIEDRGFQFADAIYEVVAVLGRRILDLGAHLDRLNSSLEGLQIDLPVSHNVLPYVIKQMLIRNRIRDGIVYIQVSRGVAQRDHAFPVESEGSSLVMTAKRIDIAAIRSRQQKGVRVITQPDKRWLYCNLKTVGLAANVLAKQAAVEASASEAWMVDGEGFITEGSSTNAWIINDDRLVTRELDEGILPGITRQVVIDAAGMRQIGIDERRFALQEAYGADEAFLTSTTNFIMPVVEIDGQTIGSGRPGPLTRAVMEAHWDHVRRETGI